jgi:nucleoside-diphosphate-sugar epimerase
MAELHVVFGAHGPLGAAIVRHLAHQGLPVRAVVRDTAAAHCAFPPSVEVHHGDALYRHSAIDSARGATVVYRCIPVRYSLWADVWLTATENIIKAARTAGARLVSPGSMYVYGRLGNTPVHEDHPLAAAGDKGRLRVATQGALCRAHRSGQVEVVIPRFPDIYGPCVTNRVYGTLFAHAAHGRTVPWFGDLDAAHDFLYVEDAAAAAVLLGQSPQAYGHVWHVPGPAPTTPRAFIDEVFRVAGHRTRVHRLSTASLRAKGLMDPETREFLEFRYLFERTQLIDGGRFAAAFPDFSYTPREMAIERTLRWFTGEGVAAAVTEADAAARA